MKPIRFRATTILLAALLLAACGGGDPDVPGSGAPAGAPTAKGAFTSIVVFGSSESDGGTYGPATSQTGNGLPPFFAGKFTTNNGTTGTVWVENLAASLGIVLTPAEVGFAGQSQKCPAAGLGLPNSCTNYAQGGARVTDPQGIGKAEGALTVPLVTQIDNHLARFGSFKGTDLVFVVGGINDLLVQFQAFGAKATQIQGQVQQGLITADQANALLFAAQTEAQAGMKQAGIEMAGYVRTKILANGAKYVAVAPVPDFASTPRGKALPAAVRAVFTDLARIYNLWLHDGLSGQPVRIVESFFDIFNNVVADPAKYGLADSATPACSVAVISQLTGGQVTDGSSLFCNATPGGPFNALVANADPATWFFADTIHPSTGGHRVIGQIVVEELKSFGWL